MDGKRPDDILVQLIPDLFRHAEIPILVGSQHKNSPTGRGVSTVRMDSLDKIHFPIYCQCG